MLLIVNRLKIYTRQKVKFGWQSVNANPEPTFLSSDGRIRSCIDHFLATDYMVYDINSVWYLQRKA